MRIAAGAIAGILAAFAIVMLIEWTGHLVYPYPSDAGLADPEAMSRAIAAIPLAAKLIVIVGWFAGALGGGLVATTVSRVRGLAWLIAGVMAVAGIVNVMMIPHPAWMQIAAVAAPLLGGFAAVHLSGLRAGMERHPDPVP